MADSPITSPDLPAGTPALPILPAIEALRIKQWVKNLIVFAPVVFASRMDDWSSWFLACQATAAFCLLASAVYLINDVVDRESDRQHPTKRLRPIASGRLSVSFAIVEALFIAALGLGLAVSCGRAFCVAVACYLAIQGVYNVDLKRRMLLDAICIACGFVLRAVGGALAIGVGISTWLVVCTFALCLFLAFCKRQCEVLTFEEQDDAALHRPTLNRYTPGLLNHLITLSGTLAIVSFLMYSTSARTIDQFGTELFVFTTPLVVYGVSRIAMISMRGIYDGPDAILLRDRALQATAVAWMACMVAIILYGKDIAEWFLSGAAK